MKPIGLAIAASFGLFLSLPCAYSAQQPDTIGQTEANSSAPIRQETAPENVNLMEAWLNENSKKVERLSLLGIEREVAESVDASENGGTPVFVKWENVRGGTGRRLGLVFLPCDAGSQLAYLYVLQRKEKAWHVKDHAEFDCRYDYNVSFETIWVRNPDIDEILVHHACGGHGTGYLEQNFSIFAVVNGKLKEELETEEVLREFPPGDPKHEIDRKSTFTEIPIQNSHLRAVEETRSGISDAKWVVQRRIFCWNPVKGKYVPSKFTPVEASPN